MEWGFHLYQMLYLHCKYDCRQLLYIRYLLVLQPERCFGLKAPRLHVKKGLMEIFHFELEKAQKRCLKLVGFRGSKACGQPGSFRNARN